MLLSPVVTLLSPSSGLSLSPIRRFLLPIHSISQPDWRPWPSMVSDFDICNVQLAQRCLVGCASAKGNVDRSSRSHSEFHFSSVRYAMWYFPVLAFYKPRGSFTFVRPNFCVSTIFALVLFCMCLAPS